MTLNDPYPIFKASTFFDAEYFRNDTDMDSVEY